MPVCITVEIPSDELKIDIVVSPTTSIPLIKHKIHEQTDIPSKQQCLSVNDIFIKNTDKLENYVKEDKCLITLKKMKKPRCPVCNKKTVLLVGDCSYCKYSYCSQHRLPESHDCSHINECKESQYKKNSDLLLSQKCVGDKVNPL